MSKNQATAPQCLAERYRPEECAAFVLLRQSGDVRLWQSSHLRADGQTREEHHVTVGDDAECLHVPDMLNALVYFLKAESPHSSRPDGFDDDRVFIVGSAHRRGPPDEHDRITLWQADQSPTFIIVGKHCKDDYIKGVWESRSQFPEIEYSELLAARGGALIELTRRNAVAQ